jgi:CheY-like chemotaxis protein
MPVDDCLDGIAVLVVEDEPAVASLAVQYLEGLGCRVDEAPSLSAAETLLASQRYAAILTDLQLTPAGNDEGLEVVRIAAAIRPKPLIVLWTGGGSPHVDEAGVRQLGAEAYLQKPAGLYIFTALLLERLAPSRA